MGKRHSHLTLWGMVGMFLFSGALVRSNDKGLRVQEHLPDTIRAGRPVSIKVTVTPLPDSVTLLYRRAGAVGVMERAMKRKGEEFVGTIDGTAVVPGKMEYAFAIVVKGQRHTTAWKTLTIQQEDTALLKVLGYHPKPQSVVKANRPLVVVRFVDDGAFDPSSVRVRLDGVDVTAMVKADDRQLTFRPPTPLTDGEHQIEVRGTDHKGNSVELVRWSFTVQTDETQQEWQLQGNLNTNAFFTTGAGNRSEVNWAGTLAGGNKKAVQQGHSQRDKGVYAQINFAKPVREGLELTNFLVMGRWGAGTAALGDLALTRSEFTLRGLTRRSVEVGYAFGQARISVVQTFGEGQGGGGTGGASDTDITVVSLAWGNERTPFHGALIYGRGENDGTPATAGFGFLRPSKGDVWGLTTAWRLNSKTQLEGEVARSHFDRDLTDAISARSATATRLGVRTTMGRTNVSLNWRSVGDGFGTPANPFVNSGRRSVNLSVSQPFPNGSLMMDFSRFVSGRSFGGGKDRSINWGINANYQPRNFPAVNLSYRRITLNGDPFMGNVGVDTVQSDWLFGLSHHQSRWGATLTVNLSRFEDGTGVSPETRTRGIQWSLFVRPTDRLDINGTLGWQTIRDSATPGQDRFTSYYLQAQYQLSSRWSMTFTFSHFNTKSRFAKFGGSSREWSVRLNYALGRSVTGMMGRYALTLEVSSRDLSGIGKDTLVRLMLTDMLQW